MKTKSKVKPKSSKKFQKQDFELDEHYIDVILRRYKKLYSESKIECLNRNFNFNELFEQK